MPFGDVVFYNSYTDVYIYKYYSDDIFTWCDLNLASLDPRTYGNGELDVDSVLNLGLGILLFSFPML